MKRKLILYVALLAIIVGGAPYLTGYLVETKFQDVVSVVNELDPVTITLVSYERGWRTSTAQTKVTFRGKHLQKLIATLEQAQNNPVDGNADATLSIMLEHDIRHGPFVQLKAGDYRDWIFALAAIHSKLFLTEKAKETLTTEFGSAELLNLNGEMSIEGVVRVIVEGKPLKFKESNGAEHVIWKGIQGKWQLSKDMKQVTGDTIIPGFDLMWDGTHYLVEDLAFHNERFKTPDGLWMSKGTVTSAAFSVKSSDANILSLTKFSMQGGADLENGMVDCLANVSIEKLVSHNKEYGPLSFSASLKNLEPGIFKSLIDLNHKMQVDNSANQAVLLQNLFILLPDLLKSHPEFTVKDLNIRTPQGDVQGYIYLGLGGPQASDLNNPTQIFNSIVMQGNFSLPKPLVHEALTTQFMHSAQLANTAQKQANQKGLTEEEMNVMVAQKVEKTLNEQLQAGVLLDKDGKYVVVLDFQKGQFKVNDKAVSLPSAGIMGNPPR